MLAVGIAAAVLVVLAVVFAGGSVTTAAPGEGVTFSDAESAALAAVIERAGGSWETLGAVGLDERNPSTISPANVSRLLGTSCAAEPWEGTALPATVGVPTFSGSFASGLAPLWLLFVNDASAGALVMVEVLNGTAVPLAQVGGTGCAASGTADRPLPSATVDSPVAARNAWSADGQGWVSGDSALTSLTLAAFGGGTYSGVAYSAVWGLVYSPCNPLLGGSTQEPMFVAALNLTTGTLSFALPYHLDCPA